MQNGSRISVRCLRFSIANKLVVRRSTIHFRCDGPDGPQPELKRLGGILNPNDSKRESDQTSRFSQTLKSALQAARDGGLSNLKLFGPGLVLMIVFSSMFGSAGFGYLFIAVGVFFLLFPLYLLIKPSRKKMEQKMISTTPDPAYRGTLRRQVGSAPPSLSVSKCTQAA